MPRVLFVLSAADSLTLADGTSHPTGFWAEEVAVAHQVLRSAGVDVDIATPGGIRPTVDPISLDERGGVDPEEGKKYAAYLDDIRTSLDAPLALDEVDGLVYDGIFLPGGHAPMADLATDAVLGRLLDNAVGGGTAVGALCHGVAALLSASSTDGAFTFAGRTITAFSDEEERQGGLGDATPYFIEDRLRERGATVTPGAPWSNTVIVDGTLVTGQNPQSSRETAERFIALLDR